MNKVEIYTSETCHYCHDAKEFLKQNNIDFTEYNISKDIDARKALMKKGYMSVPLIIIENQEILGFNRDRISKILQL
jgi:glutaredoxin-like YruB-family protein